MISHNWHFDVDDDVFRMAATVDDYKFELQESYTSSWWESRWVINDSDSHIKCN